LQQQYAVPKHKFEADIEFHGDSTLHLTLFLGESAAGHLGPERPVDLLNAETPFMPALDSKGNLILVNSESIKTVSIRDADAGDDREELALEEAVSMRVEVLLRDGARVTGTVRYLLPEAQSRLQDYLNRNGRFIPVRRRATTVFINRRFVTRVAPVGRSGRRS